MRFLILAALMLPATSVAAGTRPVQNLRPSPSDCPPTVAQLVAKRIQQGNPQLFHRLVELPPATGYAAVYRHDSNGCEDPLTMIEYRRTSR
jgi:hypothetical protein